jgi:hypothetical protein
VVGALTGPEPPAGWAGVGLRGTGETGVHKVPRRRARRRDALARFERLPRERCAGLLRFDLLRERGIWRAACWHRTGVSSRVDAAELSAPLAAPTATSSRVSATQRNPPATATLWGSERRVPRLSPNGRSGRCCADIEPNRMQIARATGDSSDPRTLGPGCRWLAGGYWTEWRSILTT